MPKILSEVREVVADPPQKFGSDWEWLSIDFSKFMKIWVQKSAIFPVFMIFSQKWPNLGGKTPLKMGVRRNLKIPLAIRSQMTPYPIRILWIFEF